ncbi:Cytosolic sulfotransferase 8 [Linum perenne]
MSSAAEFDQDPSKQNTLFWDAIQMHESDGFWYGPVDVLHSGNAFRENFQPARDDVVVLASMPKAGTTWLKSLCHCILFRDVREEDDLLTKMNPFDCVPTVEATLFLGKPRNFPAIDPVLLSERRLFHTHVPYSSLPDSITNDSPGCKLVYMARDPKDTFEDLHYDPKPHVRKLAAFLGRPFNLDVNKNDSKSQVKVLAPLLKNSHFFRRGKVGDWRNHLTMEMVERIDNVTRMKLQGTGLYTEDEQQKTA